MTDEPASSTLVKKSKKSFRFVSFVTPLVIGTNSPRITDENAAADLLEKHPLLDEFLSKCLYIEYEKSDDIIDLGGTKDIDGEHKNPIEMARRILYDYHSNCRKPLFIICTNERTSFTEHILPAFKNFGAWTGLMSFLWCEISSD
ncbi:hypothetical protein BDA99DRAFT_559999 [Phascolomyces articulosus]|uniref:Uncharacterized protein n=1 Tax=Phascolomyces articulosus TaxID=60185 RepID=A0AAD5PDT1_9FUNG|nr:hypothetical protein BDA99DRAFT_559999 [Phascolomyces articulosus]